MTNIAEIHRPTNHYYRLTKELFIEKARKKHGDKYNYDKVIYVRNDIKVAITCPIHGDFLQTPQHHMRGQGCPKCGHGDKVYGKGINDLCGVRDSAYIHWKGMLRRCYNNKYAPSYKGCDVCEDWLIFSHFKKWFDENYKEGYQLDKDILVKNNKLYSPQTCCFVPQRINLLLGKQKARRGECPIGVHIHTQNKCYTVQVSDGITNKYLGCFSSKEEAFNTYKMEKEKIIKEVAFTYYSQHLISKKVFDALVNYEISIND